MKHLIITFVALAVLGGANAYAYQADNASTPTLWKLDKEARVKADKGRRGTYYANKIKGFLDEKIEKGGIVFIGDSQTDIFKMYTAFPEGIDGKRIYNRGIGGDRIEGVLERLDVSVIDLEPSEIHVLIGVNDVLWPVDYTHGNLRPGYERLFSALKSVAPQAKIIVYSVTPIDKSQDRVGTCLQDVVTANKQLEEVCKEYGLEFRDIYSLLADKDGGYKKGMTTDGVHYSPIGFTVWIDQITRDSEQRFNAWRNAASIWQSPDVLNIDAINTYRDENMLILYRKGGTEYTTATQQNGYGYEARVENGTVTDVSPKGNMALPELPGYVLSAHGDKAPWLKANCTTGTKVSLIDGDKAVMVVKTIPTTADEWNVRLRQEVINKLATTKDSKGILKLKDIAKKVDSDRALSNEEATTLLKELQSMEKSQ